MRCPTCRTWPVSTRRFTPRFPAWRICMHCPTRCTRSTACGATGFTVPRTATWPPGPPKLLGQSPTATNCITVHLGNGCSITAVRHGKSADTSMGLTPLEGLVMGTRSGDIDPAILFYLADKGYDLAALNKLCNKESGLLGVSGLSNDMRTLTQAAAGGQPAGATGHRHLLLPRAQVHRRLPGRAGPRGCHQLHRRDWRAGRGCAGRDLQRPGTARDRAGHRARIDAPWAARRRSATRTAACDCWSCRRTKKASLRRTLTTSSNKD